MGRLSDMPTKKNTNDQYSMKNSQHPYTPGRCQSQSQWDVTIPVRMTIIRE